MNYSKVEKFVANRDYFFYTREAVLKLAQEPGMAKEYALILLTFFILFCHVQFL